MSLDEVLDRFPRKSEFRHLILSLMDEDMRARRDAFLRATKLEKTRIRVEEANAVLYAVRTLEFPPQEYEWNKPARQLCDCLWNSSHPALVPASVEAYATAADSVKDSLLILLCASNCHEGCQAIVDCVRGSGWPDPSPRVFWELAKLDQFVDVLFPALLIDCEPQFARELSNCLISALQEGTLQPASCRQAVPMIEQRLVERLSQAASLQQEKGISWRFDEHDGYFDVRHDLVFYLDLAGWLNLESLADVSSRVLSFHDPKLILAACLARLRAELRVDAEDFEKAAAAHETRSDLFDQLDCIGKLDLFPRKWRTWDAFAAAEMVKWLAQPAELGREPDELEKMKILKGKSEHGEANLYVWRFRNLEAEWYAGVSGGYLLDGEPAPLRGQHTFSLFTPWEHGTPDQHATECVATVANIYVGDDES